MPFFFDADAVARELGRSAPSSAASYGVAVRNTPIRNGPKMGLPVLSLRHFRLARWCSLSLGAWLPKISARRSLTGSGRRVAASPARAAAGRVAVFFLVSIGLCRTCSA